MYKHCKTEESARRQLHFADCLLHLLEKNAYNKVTVRTLCADAGAPRNAFYRYFNTMDDVIDLLIDSTMIWEYASYIERCAEGQGFTGLTEMEGLYEFWHSKRHLLDTLEKNGLTGRLLERIVQHYQQGSGSAYDTRFAADSTLRQMSITFSVYGLQALLLHWHHDGYRLSAAEMARRTLQLMTQPLFRASDTDTEPLGSFTKCDL